MEIFTEVHRDQCLLNILSVNPLKNHAGLLFNERYEKTVLKPIERVLINEVLYL